MIKIHLFFLLGVVTVEVDAVLVTVVTVEVVTGTQVLHVLRQTSLTGLPI